MTYTIAYLRSLTEATSKDKLGDAKRWLNAYMKKQNKLKKGSGHKDHTLYSMQKKSNNCRIWMDVNLYGHGLFQIVGVRSGPDMKSTSDGMQEIDHSFGEDFSKKYGTIDDAALEEIKAKTEELVPKMIKSFEAECKKYLK